MLSINQLNKSFGAVQALKDMTFGVHPGEIFGFVGSNGAGKTTTMRIILGVMKADSGNVTWNGEAISLTMREKIGYMPEERGLYPKMKVGEQLVYFARLHGLSKMHAQKAAEHWMERLGIASRAQDSVQKLSLGNQQRVQLAAALVANPQMLVLDEPFSGLDPVAVDVMSAVLREEAQAGKTVIFSSHQLELVEKLCDRVGIVSQGHMVAEGTLDELRTTTGLYTLGCIGPAREALASIGATILTTRSHAGDIEEVRFTCPRPAPQILASLATSLEIYEFAPVRQSLAELFKNVVTATPEPAPTSEGRKKRSLFGAKKVGA